MGLAEPPPGAQGATTLMRVDTLARTLGVPPSVLSFLEGQFPEVKAIASSSGRAYRLGEAAFLAGLVEALYHDGRPFREVQEAARSSGRTALMRRGAALIGVDLAAMRREPPAATVPPDAIVRRKGPQPEAPASPPHRADTREILAELMDCVRLLSQARRGDTDVRPRS